MLFSFGVGVTADAQGMMMRRDVLTLCWFVVALAVGCGERSGGKRVVQFWAMGSEGEKIAPLIEEFERLHADVDVRVQSIPWTAGHEKLLTAFAGDALPDVCQLGNTWIAEFASLGALQDVSARVAKSDLVQRKAYFPGLWQANEVDGRLCGIPWYGDARLLFYRTDLLAAAGFDGPPKSWPQWLAMMRKLKERAGESGFAILLPINEFEQPVILGMEAGSQLLKEGGRYGDFRSPQFQRAFTFYVDIFREGLAPAYSSTRISNVWQEFERGTFAMYITGPWNVAEFRRRLSPAMEGKWTTAPMPSIAGDHPGASIAGGSSLAIFRGSRHSDASWALVEFLSKKEQQVKFFQLTSNLPSRQDAWEAPELRDDGELAAFREQLKYARPAPPAPEWESIATGELAKSAEAAISGQEEIEGVLKKLDERVDRLLEKRRWMLARQPSAQ